MDNSWIISQLKRLEQDKVKQIEQLQAENKEQKTTIELLRKELLRLKSELSEIVKSLDKELANDEKEVNKECVGSIKELDDDLILEEFEEKVKEEGEHIIEELKDKIKNPVKVFHLSLEIMASAGRKSGPSRCFRRTSDYDGAADKGPESFYIHDQETDRIIYVNGKNFVTTNGVIHRLSYTLQWVEL